MNGFGLKHAVLGCAKIRTDSRCSRNARTSQGKAAVLRVLRLKELCLMKDERNVVDAVETSARVTCASRISAVLLMSRCLCTSSAVLSSLRYVYSSLLVLLGYWGVRPCDTQATRRDTQTTMSRHGCDIMSPQRCPSSARKFRLASSALVLSLPLSSSREEDVLVRPVLKVRRPARLGYGAIFSG